MGKRIWWNPFSWFGKGGDEPPDEPPAVHLGPADKRNIYPRGHNPGAGIRRSGRGRRTATALNGSGRRRRLTRG